MKSGKIFLIVVLVVAATIGIASIQDFGFEENQSLSQPVIVLDDATHLKTIKVDLSDGVGLGDKR